MQIGLNVELSYSAKLEETQPTKGVLLEVFCLRRINSRKEAEHSFSTRWTRTLPSAVAN